MNISKICLCQISQFYTQSFIYKNRAIPIEIESELFFCPKNMLRGHVTTINDILQSQNFFMIKSEIKIVLFMPVTLIYSQILCFHQLAVIDVNNIFQLIMTIIKRRQNCEIKSVYEYLCIITNIQILQNNKQFRLK